MAKKKEVVETVTTKTVKKVKPVKANHSSTSNLSKTNQPEINKLMIENLIILQKTMIDMTTKLDNLANQTSKLLNLFEISAKSFMERQGGITKEDQEFLEKLDKLLEQNKTIAKGLTLMEERVREKVTIQPNIPQQITQNPSADQKSRLLPRF